MPVTEYLTNNGIPNRVPISYRACSSSNAASDDLSTIPASISPKIALELQLGLDGMFFGCSSIRMRDISDGTTNTIMIGESLTDPDYVKDGQGMDYWGFGAPQTGTWDCIPGDVGGTEYSEALGSCVVHMNSGRDPTVSGVLMELSFGSYHAGGAQFVFADGSARFISENVDMGIYRALGSISGGEVIGGF
jgi:prepilin-type processing-associated H-X9-DG protein